MSKYVAMIFIDDEEDNFTESEIREMVQENCLEHADNAPFTIHGLIVRKAPFNVLELFK